MLGGGSFSKMSLGHKITFRVSSELQVANAISERKEQELVKVRLDKMSEGRKEFIQFIMQKRREEYQVRRSEIVAMSHVTYTYLLQEKLEKFEHVLAEKRNEQLNRRQKERKIKRKEEAAERAKDEIKQRGRIWEMND